MSQTEEIHFISIQQISIIIFRFKYAVQISTCEGSRDCVFQVKLEAFCSSGPDFKGSKYGTKQVSEMHLLF